MGTNQNRDDDIKLPEIADECRRFLASFQSTLLGTVDTDGRPDVSYAPVVNMDQAFYLLVSELSAHTGNMRRQGSAALLFIEDERDAAQIYARRRLSFSCHAQACDRDGQTWKRLIPLFRDQFGPVVDTLVNLQDFFLFHLIPEHGRWVTGFGKAFRFKGIRFEDAEHLGPDQVKPRS